ncbi:MAG: hypothetical protein EB168_10790, partial [Euryarchaeota archaeon]|nr:hypothetical protein [Euryarchaeota archaeon]
MDWTGFTMTRTDTQVNGVLDAKGNAIVSGYVGIGTTDPRDRLHVVKANAYASRAANPLPSNIIASSASQRLYMGTYYTGGVGACSTIQSSDYYTDPDSVVRDHGTALLLNPIGGNVGIGTDTPSAPLHIKSSGNSNPATNGIYVYNTSNTAGQDSIVSIRSGGSSAGDAYTSYDIAGEAGWATGIRNTDNAYVINQGWDNIRNQERFVINSLGNVGIGKTPAQKLDVQGGIRAYGNGSGGPSPIYSENASGSSDAYAVIFLRNNNSGSGCYWFMNSTTRSADGGANTATLRNDAGNLRLQALGENGMTITGSSINSNIYHNISSGNNSMTSYGPNSTWNAYLRVGSGSSYLDQFTAQVISTNGNLHIDSGLGDIHYYGFYVRQNGYIPNHYFYGGVYAQDDWFRVNTSTAGLYWETLGRGIWSPEAGS